MPSRWKKHNRPLSRSEFEARFPNEEACADYLVARRWPEGVHCPACGSVKCWRLKSKRFTWECGDCGRQTSITAGTIMHRSHLPLRVWFMAAHMVTSHSNGVSALQIQAQLGLGSYNTAWLLLQKLRRAMVDPERSVLMDMVEVDETDIPYRTKKDPVAGGQGRSPIGKMAIIGLVELSEDFKPRRIRLEPIKDFKKKTLHDFIVRNVAKGASVISDGWSGYKKMTGYKHGPKVVGKMAAHVLLKWVHRVFSNMKRWAMGVYHGLRRKHLQRYLDEFVFRWNRRRVPKPAFDSLLGIGARIGPATRGDFVSMRV